MANYTIFRTVSRFGKKKGITEDRNPLISMEPGSGFEPPTC